MSQLNSLNHLRLSSKKTLLTYLLRELRPSWEACLNWTLNNLRLSSKKSLLTYLRTYLGSWDLPEKLAVVQPLRNLRNPKVHHRVHKSPPLFPILSQIDPVHIIPSYLSKIYFNIVHPLTPSKDTLSVIIQAGLGSSLYSVGADPQKTLFNSPTIIPRLYHQYIFPPQCNNKFVTVTLILIHYMFRPYATIIRCLRYAELIVTILKLKLKFTSALVGGEWSA
jgi:hypothetical protein